MACPLAHTAYSQKREDPFKNWIIPSLLGEGRSAAAGAGRVNAKRHEFMVSMVHRALALRAAQPTEQIPARGRQSPAGYL